MSIEDYHDPLYRELIPQRPSPKPDNGDGPSAWLMGRERLERLDAEAQL